MSFEKLKKLSQIFEKRPKNEEEGQRRNAKIVTNNEIRGPFMGWVEEFHVPISIEHPSL